MRDGWLPIGGKVRLLNLNSGKISIGKCNMPISRVTANRHALRLQLFLKCAFKLFEETLSRKQPTKVTQKRDSVYFKEKNQLLLFRGQINQKGAKYN